MVALNFTALSSVIALTGGTVRLISDFQGNFLNVAFSDSADGTAVITDRVTGTINENTVWIFNDIGNGSVHIQCGTGTFISFPSIDDGGRIQSSPAVTNSQSPMLFNIVSVPGGSSIMPLGAPAPALALTAWESVSDLTPVAPATFSALVSGAKEQIWNITTINIPPL